MFKYIHANKFLFIILCNWHKNMLWLFVRMVQNPRTCGDIWGLSRTPTENRVRAGSTTYTTSTDDFRPQLRQILALNRELPSATRMWGKHGKTYVDIPNRNILLGSCWRGKRQTSTNQSMLAKSPISSIVQGLNHWGSKHLLVSHVFKVMWVCLKFGS